MPVIGIVSSIDFGNTSHQIQFNAGVANAAGGAALPTYKIKDKLGYNRKKIANAIDALATNAASPVTCIVTAGGLICCHEALLNVGTKPFISLIGYLPKVPFPQPGGNVSPFRGCITLDTNTMASVAARVAWITNAANWNTAPANIGLLYDENTAMATQEIDAFQAALGVALAAGQTVDAQNGRADPEQYLADFNSFPNNIQSIIVSSAPHFGKYKEQLISAANTYVLANVGPPPVRICYPLQGYQNSGGTNIPVTGKAVLIGPDIDANNANGAYFMLGQMAWTLSNAPATALAMPIRTAPSVTAPI
jgi:hypothetical protein